jgi:DNA-binding CsgD family transcriptional regulator
MSVTSSDPGTELLGRRGERAALDRMLDRARAGHSAVLVIRGEPGIGKTALLGYAAGRASGFRVVRAWGVESEMELAFAGLHQLCMPMLDRLEHLPGPQRDALRVAFGLREGNTPDQFLVGLAVLSLLADAADDQPLACFIDDAQWLDRASAQSLAFAARRLQADRVALMFAVRGSTDDHQLGNLPELTLSGLGDRDARVLLASAVHGRLDAQVRDRIVTETCGNPLALLELPRGLGPAELAGGFWLPDTRPLASRIEHGFYRQFRELPHQTQQLLLTAAAEPTGDVTLLRRAARLQGIAEDAVVAAEAVGLVYLGTQVQFRHPLVRSGLYQAASEADRRAAHRALAEATDPDIDADRRAWHRAQAAVGLDEALAADLERSAARAQARGGLAAAAAFLHRAAELTPDPARHATRALAAAQAKFAAGAPDTADKLLVTAEIGPLDDLERARLERLRAQLAFSQRRGRDAPQLLLNAAGRLASLDAVLARETFLEAAEAAIYAGRLGEGIGPREVAEAARAIPPAPQPPRASDLLLDGLVTRFTEGYAASVAPLRRALRAFCQADGRGADEIRWLWQACRVASDLWDDEARHELTSRGVTLVRDAGAISALPLALTYRAGVHTHEGEFGASAALIDEANALTEAIGYATYSYYAAMVLSAWRGQERQTLDTLAAGVQDAAGRGEGRAVGYLEHASAVLHNGLGRYQAALAAAQRACEYDDLGVFNQSLVELIEAGTRSGASRIAAAALGQLEKLASAAGTDWALGVQARSQALLSDGEAAEALYREAIERLGRTRVTVHLARAHLLYGEWLRRENRRTEARNALRAAYEMFSHMGADGFAERARRELTATGETVRKRTVETLTDLTAQEAQIARLAQDGHTNQDIAAQLFISPRTVEWHLGNVFAKLGITTRKDLR